MEIDFDDSEEIFKAQMEYAYEQGYEIGLEKGRKEAKMLIARNLLTLGKDAEYIIRFLGLSPEAVEELSAGLEKAERTKRHQT